MPLISEQKGLKIWRNDSNQFVIITLHHTADPAKCSPEWRREAAAGLTPEQAARELDIDYTAVMGAKVFPEISTNRHNIVVEEPLPDFGPTVPYWGGFDYGLRNPTSFHVYTIVDSICYCIWELYRPCPNIPEFVEEMHKCPYFHKIKYIAADPSLWYPSQQMDTGNPTSIYDKFWQAGIRNMTKGINSQEETWITMMREHWTTDDPTFRIFSRCPAMIREFETAIFVNQSERQLMTTNYRETISDKDNHALDDCKYFMLSQPKAKLSTIEWDGNNQFRRYVQPTSSPFQSQPTQIPMSNTPESLRSRGYR